jgi:hypothetical protein
MAMISSRGIVRPSQQACILPAFLVPRIASASRSVQSWYSASNFNKAKPCQKPPRRLLQSAELQITGVPVCRRRSYSTARASSELEKRIDAIPIERFRNLCVIAHIVSLLYFHHPFGLYNPAEDELALLLE